MTGSRSRWNSFADIIMSNKTRIIVIAVFFAVMSIIVLPQTKTDVDYFDMAPENIPEIEKLVEYSENFGGASFNALLIETEPKGLTYPEVIEAIYDFEVELRSRGINLYSVVDEVKNINSILGQNEIVDSLSEYAGVIKSSLTPLLKMVWLMKISQKP